MIFSDGFESGNFSAWSAQGTSAYMAVQADAKHDGNYGALAQGNGYCYKTFATSRRLAWSCWWQPFYCSAAAATTWGVMSLKASSFYLAEVYAKWVSGSVYSWTARLGVRYRDDAGAYFEVDGPTILNAGYSSDNYVFLDLEYRQASEPGANDGAVTLKLNGNVEIAIGGIDNDLLSASRCELRLRNISGSNSAWFRWDTASLDALPQRGYRVYHNSGAGAVDYATVRATRNETVSSWSSPALSCPGAWRFGMRAFNEYAEEKNLDVATELTLLGSGSPSPERPNRPTDLAATAAAGGRAHIAFSYDETNEAAACTHFHVYADDASGAIDYATPVGAIDKDDAGPVSHYEFLTDALADGVTRRFAARAATAQDVEDDGTEFAVVTPDATAPAQPASLSASVAR